MDPSNPESWLADAYNAPEKVEPYKVLWTWIEKSGAPSNYTGRP